ncbi:MAG: GNAT family N-acetyltransferase [Nocardioides sp.]
METREIDLADAAAVHRWWEAAYEVDHVDRPWSWFMTWEQLWAAFRTPSATWERHAFGLYDGDELVGGAHLQLPLLDNPHLAHAWVFVPVRRRRRGHGTLLLERVLADTVDLGRDTVLAQVYVPHGVEAPGIGFAERHGFTAGITEGSKVLDLPATEHLWDDLAVQAAPHHADYRLVTWLDVVPHELVAGYCALQSAFNEEAPSGDLDLEPEQWDEARVRDKERVFREVRRHEVGTAAVAADGTVAGLTEIMVSDFAPELAMQGGTIVLPGHRGRRLGLAMKVANQRALRESQPNTVRVVTANADVNEHMNAVNDLLGFVEVEQGVDMQRKL